MFCNNTIALRISYFVLDELLVSELELYDFQRHEQPFSSMAIQSFR